ncbi:MAG: CopG family transcriptional regulator [Egibacteraceae bacterium]
MEHEYDRGGGLCYLAAWDVHRTKVFGRCEPRGPIAPYVWWPEMVRKTTIYLDDADDALLRQAAARRGSTRSELIREAIRRLLSAETPPTRRPRPLGRSGHTDTSRRVDELLDDGFGR